MERLISVKDISERYGCSQQTARRYLRQMFHYEKPLKAPKWALDEWEKSRECSPMGRTAKEIRNEKTIVPRRRD